MLFRAVATIKRILLFKEPEFERQKESNVMKRLSSSSLRQPNILFLNIWLKQASQSLAAIELVQRSFMYDQTGS